MHHPTAAAVQLISKHAILCFKWALQIDWISMRLARTLPDHPRETENLPQAAGASDVATCRPESPRNRWPKGSVESVLDAAAAQAVSTTRQGWQHVLGRHLH